MNGHCRYVVESLEVPWSVVMAVEYEYVDWVALKKSDRTIGSLEFDKYCPLKFIVSNNFSVTIGYLNHVSVIADWRTFLKTSLVYLLIRISMPDVFLLTEIAYIFHIMHHMLSFFNT